MKETKPMCFFIMPFAPELHYFYLYLKQYLEQHHNLQCERADDQVLTMPILEKINKFIQNADVIIADCSGRNPNVMYELGIAHAHRKKVILITKEPVHEAPSDIRHYEFIHYELDKHIEFFKKLDNALHNVFSKRYEKLYIHAKKVFKEFKQTTPAQVEMASKEEFLTRVIRDERDDGLPSIDDTLTVEEFVLPKIIANSDHVAIMNKIMQWVYEKRETK
jgi:nucleoside 2-deoxyribosyltransferase